MVSVDYTEIYFVIQRNIICMTLRNTSTRINRRRNIICILLRNTVATASIGGRSHGLCDTPSIHPWVLNFVIAPWGHYGTAIFALHCTVYTKQHQTTAHSPLFSKNSDYFKSEGIWGYSWGAGWFALLWELKSVLHPRRRLSRRGKSTLCVLVNLCTRLYSCLLVCNCVLV